MSMFAPAPDPPTPLGRYRRLSPKAGVFVSPLQLGSMSLGTKWPGVGTCDKENAFKYLDAYFDAGGNFIDTCNNYQFGESEEWIGEWMEARGIRDQIVLATKYSGAWQQGNPEVKQQAAYIGNSVKSMTISVEASLKKLKTSYIDILYVHFWDWSTSIEEMMNGLHTLVAQGKVLYLGASNVPAWRVAQANQYARDHGRPEFVIFQGEWNVLSRDVERDILPLCRADGIAFANWNVLCGGKLRTDAEEEERERSGANGRQGFAPSWKRNDPEKKITSVLEKIGKEVGAQSMRAVALAYHLQKQPYVFPIIGGNKVEQLYSNIEALKIALKDEHIQEIESAVPFDIGYPLKYTGTGVSHHLNLRAVMCYDVDPLPAAIRPAKQ